MRQSLRQSLRQCRRVRLSLGPTRSECIVADSEADLQTIADSEADSLRRADSDTCAHSIGNYEFEQAFKCLKHPSSHSAADTLYSCQESDIKNVHMSGKGSGAITVM
jgi:hypothetical protein